MTTYGHLLLTLCVATACASMDDQVGPLQPVAAARWSVQHTESHGALASVWGSAPDDVWAAGGTAGKGLVLHNDGHGWTPVATGATSFLWWVYGMGRNDVYAVGAAGLIVHWDGKAWTTVASGTTQTLYGLWGASALDVWIVGGDPWGKPGDAVVLRGNAQGFQRMVMPDLLLPAAMYKVYGTPAGDVVAVGSGGTVLRYNGAWQQDKAPTTSPLVSLWGAGGERLMAVGGQGQGIMLYFDGDHWTELAGVQPGLALFGVFQAPGQPLFAVGAGPRVIEVVGHIAEESDLPALPSTTVLHSVWGDGHGTVYAVGGALYGDLTAATGVILQRH